MESPNTPNTIRKNKSVLKKGVAMLALGLMHPMSESQSQQITPTPETKGNPQNTRTIEQSKNSKANELVAIDTLKKKILMTTKDSSVAVELPHYDTSQHSTETIGTPTTKTEALVNDKASLEKTDIAKPKEETLIMDVQHLEESLKNMISESIKKDTSSSELKDLNINQKGNYLVFDAVIKNSIFDIKVSGNITQNGEMPEITDQKIDAKFFIKNKAEKKLTPLLKNIFTKFKKQLEQEKGKQIASMTLGGSGLTIQYKNIL